MFSVLDNRKLLLPVADGIVQLVQDGLKVWRAILALQ